ncbi:sigma-70 family RNA polymerase sigma factor [Actinomadura sp. DC4]|uniref:RNA polymerase sigma factor n=1 Tax=Actinomadura sp. DC4 TaxID=3055069 RepID=UPI0025B0701C|nr:sigma-70 family RNA polymerase sigma factor [Actinomadura sp. DC4]MDN3360003.1 sigma-70 family RNA polymerase sigma factor [Actinomadura sp. DC4]
MAGWPSIDRADDQRLAQSLYAGDPTALPEIYDLYAPRLFDYSHVLLRDQEGAALALHDSLITMQERVGWLPDARLFRGWIYSVTRDECLRRRAYAELPVERQRAPQAAGLEADEATRQLVHAALLVLGGQQREALDLSLRHELNPHELAEVFGVTPHEASVRVAQARHDLDDAFAAVVVAATGREDCPSVAALAGPIDEPLDADTCGKLARHISNCPICGTRGNRKVATARLLLAMPTAAIPAALRSRVLTTASAPELADLRATIAMRADPPAEPEDESDQERTAPRMWPVLASVACILVVVGAIFLMLPGSGQEKTSGEAPIASPSGSSSSDDGFPSDSAEPSPSDTKSPSPTPSKSSKTPTPTAAANRPRSHHPASNPTTRQAPGTLAVSGCKMNGTHTCSLTLTANGGPVTYRVTGTSAGVSASGSGTIAAGKHAYVPVTRDDGICIGGGSGSVSFSSGAKGSVTWTC